MDKELGYASYLKSRVDRYFGGMPKLTVNEIHTVMDQQTLEERGIVTLPVESRFSDVLKGVFLDNTVELLSRTPSGSKRFLAERYHQANVTIKKLEKMASRAQIIRAADARFPSLGVRSRVEGVLPGITGLTRDEMLSIYDRIVATVPPVQA